MKEGIEEEEKEDKRDDKIRKEIKKENEVNEKEERGGDKGREKIGNGNLRSVEDWDDEKGGKVVKNGKSWKKKIEDWRRERKKKRK